MSGSDDTKVAVVQGGDAGHAETFSDGDESGVGAAETEVLVAGRNQHPAIDDQHFSGLPKPVGKHLIDVASFTTRRRRANPDERQPAFHSLRLTLVFAQPASQLIDERLDGDPAAIGLGDEPGGDFLDRDRSLIPAGPILSAHVCHDDIHDAV